MTYKVIAMLKPDTQDKVLDDLIAAYDAIDDICTCGADTQQVIGFVEPHMLPIVTRIILRYADAVQVSEHEEAEAPVLA